MKSIKKLLYFLILVSAVTISACVTTKNADQSGFLSNYELLKRNPDFPGSSHWIDSNSNLKKYNAMIIDPVTVRLSKELIDEGAQPAPDQLNDLLGYMREAMKREFSKHVKIVNRAGENVVHYRAAITGITTVGGVTSSVTNAMPVVFALRSVTGMNNIQANLFMEAVYTDSLTGTPVSMVMQSAIGDTVSRLGAGENQVTLEHVKIVIDNWANKAALMLAQEIN